MVICHNNDEKLIPQTSMETEGCQEQGLELLAAHEDPANQPQKLLIKRWSSAKEGSTGGHSAATPATDTTQPDA